MKIYNDDKGVTVDAIMEPKGDMVRFGHRYTVHTGNSFNSLKFHEEPAGRNGLNGLTSEALLAVLIHHTKQLDAKTPNEENKEAIQYMQAALGCLQDNVNKGQL